MLDCPEYVSTGSIIDDAGISKLTCLKILDARNNENVTNVNHMTKLEILNACVNSGLTDEGIKDLDKFKLIIDSSDNKKISIGKKCKGLDAFSRKHVSYQVGRERNPHKKKRPFTKQLVTITPYKWEPKTNSNLRDYLK